MNTEDVYASQRFKVEAVVALDSIQNETRSNAWSGFFKTKAFIQNIGEAVRLNRFAKSFDRLMTETELFEADVIAGTLSKTFLTADCTYKYETTDSNTSWQRITDKVTEKFSWSHSADGEIRYSQIRKNGDSLSISDELERSLACRMFLDELSDLIEGPLGVMNKSHLWDTRTVVRDNQGTEDAVTLSEEAQAIL